ncbi:Urease accessory protein UreF [Halalkalibacter krulwichiae]|uniref:Urease accessory protein UreF n=1 Tax=Halalkalibacter krulwichiae TaxID=199441 RepID=A0A1X9MH65_9BACI|nr:Urease accessory protein UreF [Halalkalibacter krulwichiae]
MKRHLNTKDIITIKPSLLHFLQIHDSAFPIGSYTHSFGMETYIQAQKITDKQSLLNFCKTYLFSNLVFGDGLFVKEAYALALKQEFQQLKQLDQLSHAMKIAKESRQGSIKMGKQFIETILPLTDSELVATWRELIKKKEIHGHYAITYGIYAAHCQFDLEDVLAAFLYSSTTALIHNAVRAIPLGQSAGVQAIHLLFDPINEAVELVKEKTLDDLSNSSVGIELASMEHERLHSRLFIS